MRSFPSSALKVDRKKLKAEKLELLGQLKQLYSNLEDKEAELRQFIRSYEQRMRETDESIKQVSCILCHVESSQYFAWRKDCSACTPPNPFQLVLCLVRCQADGCLWQRKTGILRRMSE